MSGLDQKLVKALAHPLRVEMLRLLEEGPSSPNRLSKRIGEPLGNVSYHMKVLHKCDCIELVEVIQRRGAGEHIYKLKPNVGLGSSAWKLVPPSLRTHYAESSLAAFAARAVESLSAGTVESREGSGITWHPMAVDEQGWRELRQVLGKCEKRFQAVADKSSERMEGVGDGISVIVALAAFEMPGKEDADPK